MYLMFICLTCILVYYISNRLKFTKRPKLPPKYPGWLPLLGHIHMYYGRDQAKAWLFLKRATLECMKRGGILTFSIGLHNIIIVTDPEDANTVANMCPDKFYIYNFFKPWLGDGLLTADAITHRKTRKIMNTAFSQQILTGLIKVFNHYGHTITDQFNMELGKRFDPEPFLHANNLKTICKTSLGVDADQHKVIFDEYTKSLKAVFNSVYDRFIKFWLHSEFIFYFSDHKRKQDVILRDLHSLSDTILRKRKAQIIEARHKKIMPSEDFKPLMDKVIELSMDNDVLTEKQVRDELDTIIFGGHDTSAATLTYALVLLGSYASVQEKAYNEIIDVIGPTYREVDKLDLPKLVYLECIIKETLRLYPLSPILARSSRTEVQLKNYTIPAGSSFAILTYGVHRDALWGADVEQFKPERWLVAEALPDYNKAFMGFGAAKRGCIGKTYAMMSMKITLVHLLRQYKINADINKMTFRIDTLLKPLSGHDIAIELRK